MKQVRDAIQYYYYGRNTVITLIALRCVEWKYFDSVYTVDTDVLPITATNHIIDLDVSSISFNATIVSRSLKKPNVHAAGGPEFLNNCCNNLAYPIAYIFQLLL